MSLIHIPDDGPLSARIAVIGEAGGEQEERKRKPFVGPAGWRLGEWLTAVGLRREDLRVMNFYQHRPPNNKLELLSKDTLLQWVDDLHCRIAELNDPYVLVPTGNTALWALIGKSQPPWDRGKNEVKKPGITKLRGSIYEYVDLRGRHLKVIPTIHPAATFRQPSLERCCRVDWKRIAEDAQFRELRLPQREHYVKPIMEDVRAYVNEVSRFGADDGVLSIDIENPGGQVIMVGFSYDPSFSITIPTTLQYWSTPERVDEVWTNIAALCHAPVQKVTQKGLYDSFHLADHGIRLENWQWDLLGLHHCCDPSDKHDLGYMASCDSREPYWKDEAKDPDEAAKWATDLEALWVYNGKDAAVQRELVDVYYDRVVNRGLLDFYFTHYRDLYPALLPIMRHGFRVDDTQRRRREATIQAEIITEQDRLTEMTGIVLYGKKALSTKKLQTYMYETLHLPKQYAKRGKTGDKTLSTDEVSVRKMVIRYPERFGPQGEAILGLRRRQALLSFYSPQRVDPDGRFRSSYDVNTEEGRLSSSANPRGTGANAQNIDREARDIFLADEGCIGLNVDLSQAEGRVCYALIYALTGEKELLQKARARPDEYDQHTENAARIFNVSEADVTKEQRYLGKTAVHAAQRGQQGEGLMKRLLKDGYVYTESECQEMIDAYVAATPGLLDFFRETRAEIITQRYLEDSWGGRLWFTYDRLDDSTYRCGYSYKMQPEVARLLNQYGLLPLHRAVSERIQWGGLPPRVNAHVHDSLFISVRPKLAYDVASFLVTSLEQPRQYRGVELSIPCEVTIGRTWKGETEFKRLPSRKEFEEAVDALVS